MLVHAAMLHGVTPPCWGELVRPDGRVDIQGGQGGGPMSTPCPARIQPANAWSFMRCAGGGSGGCPPARTSGNQRPPRAGTVRRTWLSPSCGTGETRRWPPRSGAYVSGRTIGYSSGSPRQREVMWENTATARLGCPTRSPGVTHWATCRCAPMPDVWALGSAATTKRICGTRFPTCPMRGQSQPLGGPLCSPTVPIAVLGVVGA